MPRSTAVIITSKYVPLMRYRTSSYNQSLNPQQVEGSSYETQPEPCHPQPHCQLCPSCQLTTPHLSHSSVLAPAGGDLETPGGWRKVGASADTLCSPPQLSDELKRHLNSTLTENYGQPRAAEITASVDRLQQDVSHTERCRLIPCLCLSQSMPLTLGKLCHPL